MQYLRNPKSTQDRPGIYNVVLLGETQSGKSTLVEMIKSYADPTCVINRDAIGDGLFSHTENVERVTVKTRMPNYIINEMIPQGRQSRSKVLDIQALMDIPDQNAYEKEINRRKDVQLVQGVSDSPGHTFNLFDTPGLNATNGYDEVHVARIFENIQSIKDVSLIIVLMGPGPFTPRLKSALRTYTDIFPELMDNMVFLHTHTDYAHLHPSNTRFSVYMKERRETIHQLMGGRSFTHLFIDCDLDSRRPIRRCLTMNTIQSILQTATFNRPIVMARLKIQKTPKMRDADGLIKAKYELMLSTVERTLSYKDKDEGSLLAAISKLENSVVGARRELEVLQEDIRMLDVDELQLLHESRNEKKGGVNPANETMEFQSQNHLLIAEVDCLHKNVKIKSESGGRNHDSWKIVYSPTRFHTGTLHARAYAKKRAIHQAEITKLNARRSLLSKDRDEAMKEQERLVRESAERLESMSSNAGNHDWCLQMIKRASRETLEPDIFLALAQTNAFDGSAIQNMERVESVYLEATRKAKGAEVLPPVFLLQDRHPGFGKPAVVAKPAMTIAMKPTGRLAMAMARS